MVWTGAENLASPPGFDHRSVQPGSLNETFYFLSVKKLQTFEAESIKCLVCNNDLIRHRSDSSEKYEHVYSVLNEIPQMKGQTVQQTA